MQVVRRHSLSLAAVLLTSLLSGCAAAFSTAGFPLHPQGIEDGTSEREGP
jgi:hypothetical protein